MNDEDEDAVWEGMHEMNARELRDQNPEGWAEILIPQNDPVPPYEENPERENILAGPSGTRHNEGSSTSSNSGISPEQLRTVVQNVLEEIREQTNIPVNNTVTPIVGQVVEERQHEIVRNEHQQLRTQNWREEIESRTYVGLGGPSPPTEISSPSSHNSNPSSSNSNNSSVPTSQQRNIVTYNSNRISTSNGNVEGGGPPRIPPNNSNESGYSGEDEQSSRNNQNRRLVTVAGYERNTYGNSIGNGNGGQPPNNQDPGNSSNNSEDWTNDPQPSRIGHSRTNFNRGNGGGTPPYNHNNNRAWSNNAEYSRSGNSRTNDFGRNGGGGGGPPEDDEPGNDEENNDNEDDRRFRVWRNGRNGRDGRDGRDGHNGRGNQGQNCGNDDERSRREREQDQFNRELNRQSK
ncbi:hypothetical protein BT96DRAFT_1008382 [Gymnopus androsaceus JB14]|uniref:Uncharacterized protein n=1 Tax=Gymnopus androsaceus JB14 TaxID=1447944 RepID=A0A6A4GFL5_9AGAR|nr:hypothetical protein BT96DRAFT_1008382 [Gymnopus androsaceus JB14]